MGNKSTVCYECGGTVLATDQNTNYEPVVRLVKGKAETLHRHKDCSQGDIIIPYERSKAQIVVGGNGNELPEPKMTQDEEDDLGEIYDDDLWEEDEVEEPMTPLEKEKQAKKDQEYQKEFERIKKLMGGLNKIKGNEVPFPQQAPKTKEDDGSIRLNREEREALAAALYIADVVEITGEKLVNPRRFNAEMKKVLYKVIKDL